MAYQAGRAFVTVTPSFKGFQIKAAEEAKKLRAIKIPVQYDFQDMPATMPTKRPIKVPVEAELSGSFDRDVRSKLTAALKSLPKDIGLKVDASDAEREIASLRTQLETLSTKKIGVDISADDALTEIAYVRGELDRLGASSPDVQVRADSASAIASLEAVQTMVDKVDAARVNIQADADTARAEEKLRRLERAKSRAGGSVLITAAVSALPMAGPLAAVGGGAAAGLAGIGAAGIAGVAGGAAIGMASIKHALDLQKQLTASSKARTSALSGVRSAEAGLASAVRGSSNAQIASARSVAAAERGVADARRAGAQAVGQAEQGVADARRASARSIASAEAGLADARRNSARVAVQSERQIQAAEDQLKSSQDRVKQSLDALHAAREQAKRDLEDLKERTKDNALTQESADIALIDAQNHLAALEKQGNASALDLRKARLDVAEAEDAVADSRRQSSRDAADLAKVEKHGDPGVNAAKAQVAQARKDAAAARRELGQARRDAAAARADAARGVAAAQTNLSQAQADGARQVQRAEQNLARTRQDAARNVKRAEQNLADARAAGARQVASSQAQIAAAQARVAAAQDKLNGVDAKRDRLIKQMTPSVKALVAGTKTLAREWHGFLNAVSKPIDAAALGGMTAIEKALPGLARFIRPVARGLADVFKLFGNAAASRGAKQFATDFGRFSGSIIRDAGRGFLNLAHGLGNLLRAFMPLSGGMAKGLVNLTKRFAVWSDSLGKSKGFQNFIGYVRKEGPVVMAVLSSIGKVVAKTLQGLAPLGGVVLAGLKGALGFLGKMSPGQLAGIAVAIGGIALAIQAVGFAYKVAAAADKVYAAAQWLVNAAMDANPIGLVVIAIAALVGGFIIAYKHSATFRKFINALGDAFKTFFGWVKKNWPLILAILTGPIGLATLYITRHWDKITKAFKDAKNWAVGVFKRNWATILAVLTGPIGLATLFISRHWDTITKAFRDAKNWAVGTFSKSWAAVQGILTAPITAAKNAFHDLLGPGGTIRKIFSSAVTAIGNIWGDLQNLAQKPVQFVVNTVIRDHLLPAIRHIPGLSGFAKGFKGWATGGYTGPGGKHEPAGIVHKGEFVLNKETTARARPVIEALHRTGGRMFGYAQGGPVGGGGSGIYRPTATGGYGGLQVEGGFNAVDIGVPQGTPIHAAASGRVTISKDLRGYEPRNTKQNGYYSYGRYIQIHHAHGNTIYAHMVRRIAGVGEQVRGGELIGYSGHTGHTRGRTGDHVHFGANGSPTVYAYMGASTNYAGRGSATGAGGSGGGGSASGGGYGGPSLSGILSAINPAKWMSHLRDMGGFGSVLAGSVKSIVGNVKSFATDKIHALIKAAASKIGGVFGGGINVSGSGARAVWSALRSAGFNKVQAAGIMGNIQAESGFRANIIQGGGSSPYPNTGAGYGLVQWTPGTKLKGYIGNSRATIGNEIGALRAQLNGRGPSAEGAAGAALRSARTPEQAAMLFQSKYERPKHINYVRAGWARDWYNKFDKGGYLPPGLSAVYNGTGKPEPVFTNDQWAEMRKANRVPGGSSNQRPIHIDGTIDPMRVAHEVIRQETWAGVG